VTQNYRTDLTDSQWHHIKDFFPAPKESGRPREVDFRQVVNAILFLLVTGCQRRMIPLDFPSGKPFITILPTGKRMEHGFGFTKLYAPTSAPAPVKRNIRQPDVLIRKRLKPLPCRHPEALTQARRSWGKRHLLVDTLG
jgi:hypothetical protein